MRCPHLMHNSKKSYIDILYHLHCQHYSQGRDYTIQTLPPHYITIPVLLSSNPDLPSATNSTVFLRVDEFIVPTNCFGVNRVATEPKPKRCVSSLSSHSSFSIPSLSLSKTNFKLRSHQIFVILRVSYKFTCLTLPKLSCCCLLVCCLS